MTSAMLDIETLDTVATSVVLSIGVVKFNERDMVEPYEKTVLLPSLDEQLDLERTTSEDTLAWWAKQDKEILDRALSEDGRVPLDNVFKSLNKYLVGVDKIWCQGPQFDMVIIENLFAQSNHHTNWKFWQIMDCRTIFNMMPKDPRKAIQQNLHDAGEDAYWQAVCVQQTYSHFGIS